MKILITDKQLVSLVEQLGTLKKLLQVSKEAKPITKVPQVVKSISKEIKSTNLDKKVNPLGYRKLIAPHGVIFFGENKVLVGDMHGEPHVLSNDLIDKIVKIANKYGFWGEGVGIKHNKAILKSPLYPKLNKEKHMGSWDSKVKKPKETKHVFLYSLFSNIKSNKRLEKFLKIVKKDETIFDLLARTIPMWSADMGRYNLGVNDLKKFLIDSSGNGVNFLELSKQKATEKNLKNFLIKGEKLQWPKKIWNQYPYPAGQVARTATKIRDEHLINAGPGVYFVGSGHLTDIMKMVGKEKGLKLIGGEKIIQ